MAMAAFNPLDPNDPYSREQMTTPVITPTSAGWTNTYDPASGVVRQLDPTRINQAATQESAGFNLPKTFSGNLQDLWTNYRNQNPSFRPTQAQATSLQPFVDWAKQQGANISIAPAGSGGYVKGILDPQGQFIKLLNGMDQPIWLPGGDQPSLQSSYSAQFSDPLTAQYEQLLQSQTALYQQQQAQMQQEATRQQATRDQTAAAAKQLTDFLQQRVAKLQQPAYSGAEQEVLRTRALEPIENDRAAAQKRALENIGSRGFDPSSGIAQELLQQTNRSFDQERSRAQNDLAYNQIQEQRSRDQEAQQLLQYLAQLPEATARGDLGFVDYLNQLVNQPGQSALATGGTLADLPVQRTQLAAQIAGLPVSPTSSVQGLLSLLQNAQSNRYLNQGNSADFWRQIGLSFL